MRPKHLALLALALQGCVVGRILGQSALGLLAHPAPAARATSLPVTGDARLAVLWVGHATVLLQLGDKVVMTDPVLTETVGYLSRRLVEPGITARHVPELDAVVISHMHLDHLSTDTLFELKSKIHQLLLPPGGEAYVPDYGFPMRELALWQTADLGGLKITAIPVKHDGWRYGIDALWHPRSFAGYVFEYQGMTVYFGGDSAWAPELLSQVHQRFPHIDLALLPIAPLEPRSFMARTHMDPRQAIAAFQLLGADRMIPIHFDTFINSFDQPGDAVRALDAAIADAGLDPKRVARLKIGERRVMLKSDPAP